MATNELLYIKKSDRKVLKPFKIQNKVFYPIIDILTSDINNKYYSTIITPVAFVVEENGEKYIIYLNDEDIGDNELFSLIASVK